MMTVNRVLNNMMSDNDSKISRKKLYEKKKSKRNRYDTWYCHECGGEHDIEETRCPYTNVKRRY